MYQIVEVVEGCSIYTQATRHCNKTAESAIIFIGSTIKNKLHCREANTFKHLQN